MKQFASSHSRLNKRCLATCCRESVAGTTEPKALKANMRSLRVGPQCLGHCSSSVAAAEDRGILTQQRWDAHGCLRSGLAAVWFLTPNTCMCGAARTPCVKGLEHHALFDRGKPERKLCAYWVQTHSAGRSPFYLFIFEFVFIGPATVQPRLAHETCHMGTYRRGKDMGAHPQRQHDLHMPFPIHVQPA